MAEYDEVEFERVRSEEASGDVEMLDAVQSYSFKETYRNGSPRLTRTL